MKNMKKLLQKAMVFTLAAAMLVVTPMTASAAGLADVYSIQKPGMGVDEEHDVNTSGTGTVTNTETGSSALTENESHIMGIVLDRDTVEAEKGVKETLSAEIVMDSADYTTDPVKKAALGKLYNKIVWKIGRLENGQFQQDTEMSKILGMYVDTANGNTSRATVTLEPKQGTAEGKEVYIQASINGSYYLDEEGNEHEYAEDMGVLTALAKVSVKEYTEKLAWSWSDKGPAAYKDHKIDLSKYLVRTPATANDTITWAVKVTSGKANDVTISDAGVLTIKKDGVSFIAYAMGERCPRLSWKVEKTEAGVQATKVELHEVKNDKLEADILRKWEPDVGGKTNEGKEIKVFAKLIATKSVVLDADKKVATTVEAAEAGKKNGKYSVGNKPIAEGETYIEATKTRDLLVPITKDGTDYVRTLTITDDVTWEVPAKQAGVASVVADAENDRYATVKVSKDATPGTTTVTAKTPKKSAKMTVKVAATLIDVKITNTEKELYSGQTLQMTYTKNPAGNKDNVRWTIKKDGGKEKNASINGKGLLTIKPTVNDGDEITVVLTSPKKGTRGETKDEYKITVKQSSIDGITVTEVSPAKQEIAKVYVEGGKVRQQAYRPARKTELSIPVNARYEIDVVRGENVDLTKFTDAVAKNTLTYKNSSAKVVDITRMKDGKLTIVPKAPGNAAITVSGVRATMNGNKVTGKAISTTFRITVSQPVTTLTLSKPNIVVAEKIKNGQPTDVNVSGLKVTFGPKNANKRAEKAVDCWQYKKSTDVEWSEPIMKGNKKLTAVSLSWKIPKAQAGDVYEIRVTSATGLQKIATVKVVSPTAALGIASEKVTDGSATMKAFTDSRNRANNATVEVGSSIKYYPCVNLDTTGEAKWYNVGSESLAEGNRFSADGIASCTVNKKGIVSINQKTGEIKGMKNGKVAITFKTNTGKSVKLNVEVTLPEE